MKPENTTPEISKYPNVKAEFEQWALIKYPSHPTCILAIHLFPFEMQQGVYLAFLREKGIHLIAQVFPSLEYRFEDINSAEWNNTLPADYTTALIAAIEAGFQKLEAA